MNVRWYSFPENYVHIKKKRTFMVQCCDKGFPEHALHGTMLRWIVPTKPQSANNNTSVVKNVMPSYHER